MSTTKLLMVCMGNICRSPAAEAVMRKVANRFGRDVIVESAGTHGYHVGDPPDRRMTNAAKKRGYEMTSRGRQVQQSDLQAGRYTLILAMDRANYDNLCRLSGGAVPENVRLFSDYLDESWPRDVPDPYYGGADGFETVLDMLEAGCPNLLKSLESGVG